MCWHMSEVLPWVSKWKYGKRVVRTLKRLYVLFKRLTCRTITSQRAVVRSIGMRYGMTSIVSFQFTLKEAFKAKEYPAHYEQGIFIL